MAILPEETRKYEKRVIDLKGPDGNAYYLLGLARSWGKQLDLDVDELTAEMRSDDYEHLLEVFDEHFGSICDLQR